MTSPTGGSITRVGSRVIVRELGVSISAEDATDELELSLVNIRRTTGCSREKYTSLGLEIRIFGQCSERRYILTIPTTYGARSSRKW